MDIDDPLGLTPDLARQLKQLASGLPAGMEEWFRREQQMNSLLKDQWDQLQPVMARFERDVLGPTKEIARVAASLVDPIQQQLKNFDFGFLEQIDRVIRELPARTRRSLLELAELGWYLDPEMDAAGVVGLRLDDLPADALNAEFVAYFRQHLDRIERDLVSHHPTRAHLIQSAFRAHGEGHYDLSIPALLAQADGVCRDLTGCEVFRTGLRGHVAKANVDDVEAAYLAPLLQAIPLTYPEGKRKQPGFQALNRHAVLHGETLDFGTEANGLRAISLLNYVSYVLREEPQAAA